MLCARVASVTIDMFVRLVHADGLRRSCDGAAGEVLRGQGAQSGGERGGGGATSRRCTVAGSSVVIVFAVKFSPTYTYFFMCCSLD